MDRSRSAGWRGEAALTAWFVAVVLAVGLMKLPEALGFAKFAWHDSGVDLTIQSLLDRGLRPTVDFGYIYGLLPLLVNRRVYDLAGRSAEASVSASMVMNLILAWGLARFARGARVGPAGVVLISAAVPDLMRSSTFVLMHVLEQTLLVHALAEQSRGRRDRALALATACAFTKPSMAYVYGAILMAAIARGAWGRGWRAWLRELRPAIAVGAGLAVVLGGTFGLGPLLATLTPGAGLAVYREGGYGFFRGDGRLFWWRPGAGLMGYLRFEVGFWLAGTACLLGGGLVAARRVWLGRGTGGDEMAATCAALHAAFVGVFFGNRWSWMYYFAVLVLGLAAIGGRGRRSTWLVGALAAMLLFSDKAHLQRLRQAWRDQRPNFITAGLWAGGRERADWIGVTSRLGPGRVAFLAEEEGLTMLMPRFGPPEGAYFVPGHPLPAEVNRKAKQVAEARRVVVVGPRGLENFARWPALTRAFDGLVLEWHRGEFWLYRRGAAGG